MNTCFMRYICSMTETSDRLWKRPQKVKDYAKSSLKKSKPSGEYDADTWKELKNHPSWNNLFTMLENYINYCEELEKKVHLEKRYDCDITIKKISIRKKYKKYKKRYKLFKSETLRTSDSSFEYTSHGETQKIEYEDYEKSSNTTSM